jgi:hypothetical protein
VRQPSGALSAARKLARQAEAAEIGSDENRK